MPADLTSLAVQADTHLTEAAALARSCRIAGAARQLAAWTGSTGRRVTPTGALSPAEVSEAATVLGVRVTLPVRRAADVPDLHRGWLMAVGAGLVRVASGRGVAVGDEAAGTDEHLLTGWLEGLLLICADLSGPRRPETLRWLVLLVLEAIQQDWAEVQPTSSDGYALVSRVRRTLPVDDSVWRSIDEQKLGAWLHPPYPGGGDWRLFGLLADAGAVAGTASATEVTALGRWLAGRLREQAPLQVAPDWPPSAVLDHLRTAGADADVWSLTAEWRWAHPPVDAASQLLAAAAGTDAATRRAAVRLVIGYGETALPAWLEVLGSDDLGPHARQVLSWWERGPGPQTGDRWWLGVESAAAALPDAGPDEALTCLADAAERTRDARPDALELLGAVPGSGHPEVEPVMQALTGFLASGAPRSIEQQLQVKVRLSDWRPETWRRLLIPATDSLGGLSWTIAVLFGWGQDHLHVFEAGQRRFTDPLYPLEGADDEHDARLSRLFAAGARKLTYTYDLGACWRHEIVLERLVPMTPDRPALQCVAFSGDGPLEYPELEDDDGRPIADPVVTKPFRLDEVNRTLASGHYVVDGQDEAW